MPLSRWRQRQCAGSVPEPSRSFATLKMAAAAAPSSPPGKIAACLCLESLSRQPPGYGAADPTASVLAPGMAAEWRGIGRHQPVSAPGSGSRLFRHHCEGRGLAGSAVSALSAALTRRPRWDLGREVNPDAACRPLPGSCAPALPPSPQPVSPRLKTMRKFAPGGQRRNQGHRQAVSPIDGAGSFISRSFCRLWEVGRIVADTPRQTSQKEILEDEGACQENEACVEKLKGAVLPQQLQTLGLKIPLLLSVC
ncbi:uncharacterized protein LOC117011518 [Catharus ustulatus]|uniref:uncharacterized protein LOC117011518 n=1 Tax=Catharus ustulatus TaxID=91951 RepID=UPI00140E66D5|nr:uncharacterized protein LOC117011518 [Catharus ustulatus]